MKTLFCSPSAPNWLIARKRGLHYLDVSWAISVSGCYVLLSKKGLLYLFSHKGLLSSLANISRLIQQIIQAYPFALMWPQILSLLLCHECMLGFSADIFASSEASFDHKVLKAVVWFLLLSWVVLFALLGKLLWDIPVIKINRYSPSFNEWKRNSNFRVNCQIIFPALFEGQSAQPSGCWLLP